MHSGEAQCTQRQVCAHNCWGQCTFLSSSLLALPCQCDLGRRHSWILPPPTLCAREVGVACNLDCPCHPHRHDMQANLVTQDDPRTSGGGEAGGAALFDGAGDLARPGRGVLSRLSRLSLSFSISPYLSKPTINRTFRRGLEVIEIIDFILDFTAPPHQIRRLWRHPRPTYQSTIG